MFSSEVKIRQKFCFWYETDVGITCGKKSWFMTVWSQTYSHIYERCLCLRDYRIQKYLWLGGCQRWEMHPRTSKFWGLLFTIKIFHFLPNDGIFTFDIVTSESPLIFIKFVIRCYCLYTLFHTLKSLSSFLHINVS